MFVPIIHLCPQCGSARREERSKADIVNFSLRMMVLIPPEGAFCVGLNSPPPLLNIIMMDGTVDRLAYFWPLTRDVIMSEVSAKKGANVMVGGRAGGAVVCCAPSPPPHQH